MLVYDFTYKTLGHTHYGIYTASEMVEYSSSKKGMELERNFSFNISSIKERSLKPHKYFFTKIIDKPGHGHMR